MDQQIATFIWSQLSEQFVIISDKYKTGQQLLCPRRKINAWLINNEQSLGGMIKKAG